MKLAAINVGQGDSFVLSDIPLECLLKKEKEIDGIIVDLGDGHTDVTHFLERDKKYILCLTHSHLDHIGGLKYIIKEGLLGSVIRDVWVPCYMNQLLAIQKFILDLGNKYGIPQDNGNMLILESTLEGLGELTSIEKSLDISIYGIYNGFKYTTCQHLTFLNPFRPPISSPEEEFLYKALNIKSTEISQKEKELIYENHTISAETFFNKKLSKTDNNSWVFSSIWQLLSEGGSWGRKIDIINDDYLANRKLSQIFLFSIRQELIDFITKPSASLFYSLNKKVDKNINNLSIVFKYDDTERDHGVLMTGDAEIPVFETLVSLQPDCLRTKILKVPHHGSSTGLNSNIFKAINPAIGILSHNNRRFGKGKCHPHSLVLDLFEANMIPVIHTNPLTENEGGHNANYINSLRQSFSFDHMRQNPIPGNGWNIFIKKEIIEFNIL